MLNWTKSSDPGQAGLLCGYKNSWTEITESWNGWEYADFQVLTESSPLISSQMSLFIREADERPENRVGNNPKAALVSPRLVWTPHVVKEATRNISCCCRLQKQPSPFIKNVAGIKHEINYSFTIKFTYKYIIKTLMLWKYILNIILIYKQIK